MKIILENFGQNIYNLMRRCGYFYQKRDEKTGQEIFIKKLSPSGYPRFHIYLSFNQDLKKLAINLHLDQKKPIYKGVSAHAGEYEGEVVEKEAKRIKQEAGL